MVKILHPVSNAKVVMLAVIDDNTTASHALASHTGEYAKIDDSGNERQHITQEMLSLLS
jgi:hypothetical protein